MKIVTALLVLFFLGFKQTGQAQNTALKDSVYAVKTPIIGNISNLFSAQSVGFQLGIEKYVVQKEIQKLRKSGRIKTIEKDRFLALDLGYYYQNGLHHNWFLTAAYALKRTKNNGFFTEFKPMLGVSRTFLTEETYVVDTNGGVALNKFAGNWYVTSGFSYGIGKTFKADKNYFLKDIYAKTFLQVLYPNFVFIALKPSLQIGTSIRLNHYQKSIKKIIKRHF